MFVEIVRANFKPNALHNPDIPWHWAADLKTTGIFAESGWNENLEARNVRPGVWVDVLQNIYGKVSIGDQDQMPVQRRSRLENFYCTAELDVVMDCTSPKRGESIAVGSQVQNFLHMSSDIIQAQFGLQGMSPVILNRAAPFEKDVTMWNAQVQFRVYYEVRWATLPMITVLNDINMSLRDKENPEEHFRDIALRRDPTTM